MPSLSTVSKAVHIDTTRATNHNVVAAAYHLDVIFPMPCDRPIRLETTVLFLPCLLLFLNTGCYTRYYSPGAVGQIVDAQTGAPVRVARVTRPALPHPVLSSDGVTEKTVKTDPSGKFDLPPASRAQLRFMYLRNPDSISGSFLVTADGYATNSLTGTATARTLWRVKLGKVELQKP